MADYRVLKDLVRAVNPRSPNDSFTEKVVPYLVGIWLDDYTLSNHDADIVETTDSGFSYLFDIACERLIAAWGISGGRHGEPRKHMRDPFRRQFYHRGHAIPHTLGGPTHINLVPQLGKINSGPFQKLERNAVATPGSLYFTYWTYAKNDPTGQTPASVEQGLLIAGHPPVIKITQHGN